MNFTEIPEMTVKGISVEQYLTTTLGKIRLFRQKKTRRLSLVYIWRGEITFHPQQVT